MEMTLETQSELRMDSPTGSKVARSYFLVIPSVIDVLMHLGSGLTTEVLLIPNELVGIIIGKNGNKINEIRLPKNCLFKRFLVYLKSQRLNVMLNVAFSIELMSSFNWF